MQDPEVAEAAQNAGAIAERDLVDAPGLGGGGQEKAVEKIYPTRRLREFSLVTCLGVSVSQDRL